MLLSLALLILRSWKLQCEMVVFGSRYLLLFSYYVAKVWECSMVGSKENANCPSLKYRIYEKKLRIFRENGTKMDKNRRRLWDKIGSGESSNFRTLHFHVQLYALFRSSHHISFFSSRLPHSVSSKEIKHFLFTHNTYFVFILLSAKFIFLLAFFSSLLLLMLLLPIMRAASQSDQ